MEKITIQNFFEPIKFDEDFHDQDYEKVIPYVNFAKSLSQITYQSVYLVDYYKRRFLYVSDNPIFLCGHTPEQVLRFGYLFYFKNVPEEDLELLLKINQAGFLFFKQLPPQDRLKYSISYDFNLIQPEKNLMLINHKLKPLLLDKKNDPWIALCLVSISPNSESGNALFKSRELKKLYKLNVETGAWIETESPKLNSREKEVLILSAQGLTMEEIALKAFISLDTVKFHKRNIFLKLNVKSVSEAITAALDLALI